jgi:hypothetical protein
VCNFIQFVTNSPILYKEPFLLRAHTCGGLEYITFFAGMSRGNKVHTKNAVGIVVQLHPSAQFVTNNPLCALFGTKPYLCFLVERTHTSGRLELPLTPWGLSQKCPQHLGVFPRVMNLLACLPECPVQCGTHCTVGIYT